MCCVMRSVVQLIISGLIYVGCTKAGSTGIEINLCFQPVDPSVELVSNER